MASEMRVGATRLESYDDERERTNMIMIGILYCKLGSGASVQARRQRDIVYLKNALQCGLRHLLSEALSDIESAWRCELSLYTTSYVAYEYKGGPCTLAIRTST